MKRILYLCCIFILTVFIRPPVVYSATQITGTVTEQNAKLVKITFKPLKAVGPKHGDRVKIMTKMRKHDVIAGRGIVKDFGHEFVWAKIQTGHPREKMTGVIYATGKPVDNLFANGIKVKELRGVVEILPKVDGMSNHLTLKQKKARIIAGAALVEEINRSANPSEPVMMRTFWDEDFVSASELASKGLNKGDINAQRRSLLLEMFRLNSDMLSRKFQSMGIAGIDNKNKAYDFFLTKNNHNTYDMQNFFRQVHDMRGDLRPFNSRIYSSYVMLPEDDQKALNKIFDDCEKAWFQVRMKTNSLENSDNFEKTDANKETAMAVILSLRKFDETAATIAVAAEKRLQ